MLVIKEFRHCLFSLIEISGDANRVAEFTEDTSFQE